MQWPLLSTPSLLLSILPHPAIPASQTRISAPYTQDRGPGSKMGACPGAVGRGGGSEAGLWGRKLWQEIVGNTV